ncbi:MAG: precorrin-4 C(11)-methyltransferase [Lachnospiraceae bacterium]
MIHFVGAGPGAEDLITVRGKQLLEEADVIIYAGSLVNPNLLKYADTECQIYNSAKMTLEEVLDVMQKTEEQGKTTVRLHTGDPCIYGAIREQMDVLDEKNIAYDSCPGVSSFCGAAAALDLEYTLPEISQSVVITRMEGRTPVPAKESIASFAAHQATMVIFLSTGMLEELSARLIEGGYTKDTPAAIVYKATWEDEKKFICTVGTLAQTAKEHQITKTALMIIGDVVHDAAYDRSKLYDPTFSTEYREAKKQGQAYENRNN